MITTTQLRVLRTCTRVPSTKFPIRVASSPFYTRRHVPPCLPQSTPRSLSTTSLLSAAEASKTSTPLTHAHEPARHSPRSTLSPTAANPPPTTRPPPLDLPTRDPNKSTFSFYFATGKAYLTFYKTGLKNIYLNTRLVWSLNAAAGVPRADTPGPGDTITATTPSPTSAVGSTTRSTLLLRRRWRYDVRRLPLFALLLLVCGEFTPLVVMAMPALVPYTCRIPRQIEAMRRKVEGRRAASFKRLEEKLARERRVPGEERQTTANVSSAPLRACLTDAEVSAHIVRSLNLISPLWDRLGLVNVPALPLSARRKVVRYVAFLREDDALLAQAGGVDALESEEVVLACADRAIRTAGRSEDDLRERLRWWLEYVPGQTDATDQVKLLTDRLLDKHD